MKKHLTQKMGRWIGWGFLAGAATLAGCQTADQADSGELASVEISGHTEAEIQQTAARVFLADGYQQTDRLTFEKQGSSWDTVAYHGWSSSAVWIRVRADITSSQMDKYILGCNAYMVTDRNVATMEEEKKISFSHRTECKKILDQIKARLDSPPAAATP